MTLPRIAALVVAATLAAPAPAPRIASVSAAMQDLVARQEVSGAVTVVATRGGVVHLDATGLADLATKRPMTPDTLFWIASMTKPITGAAILMLQDEGKLKVSDPVAKYLPAFETLRTPSGKPANLTITQVLTHTSGLGEADPVAAREARTLTDMERLWLAAPMQYEPGTQWKYTQSGINVAGRIVEVVSGKPFDVFVRERLFDPLGMKDTTFSPSEAQRARLVTAYTKHKDTGVLEATPHRADYGVGRPPFGNGGLYSTGPDYARFAQMLLNGGTLDGKRYLSAEAMRTLTTPLTGDLPTGFFQGEAWGNRGANYGWGLATCILKTPHDGVASMLSPGTFGHGGAWGTQAWIDPVKGVAYVLMIQRAGLPNSDASDVRLAFQRAAAAALPQ
ncbi:serine hydrolase [Luteitalea sp. TBR-22]|uniref:serine hydrolase domain-containing protein n=1 Tax=Luteitalea sp. TBR-22 TaxID=2802971 RepID=UPI001AFC9475|nr:serine hydrolase domain-containing protein [Luteitalea sp. TBR-22]BCS30925.1 serine hydrolase [Luteitalea sp. TBR-22]